MHCRLFNSFFKNTLLQICIYLRFSDLLDQMNSIVIFSKSIVSTRVWKFSRYASSTMMLGVFIYISLFALSSSLPAISLENSAPKIAWNEHLYANSKDSDLNAKLMQWLDAEINSSSTSRSSNSDVPLGDEQSSPSSSAILDVDDDDGTTDPLPDVDDKPKKPKQRKKPKNKQGKTGKSKSKKGKKGKNETISIDDEILDASTNATLTINSTNYGVQNARQSIATSVHIDSNSSTDEPVAPIFLSTVELAASEITSALPSDPVNLTTTTVATTTIANTTVNSTNMTSNNSSDSEGSPLQTTDTNNSSVTFTEVFVSLLLVVQLILVALVSIVLLLQDTHSVNNKSILTLHKMLE